MSMSDLKSIGDYLRSFAAELGERIVDTHHALHTPADPVSPRMKTLLRRPYRVQELAAMGVVRRWERARAAAVIGECGTGKTLIALAAIHCHAEGRPYTALALVPGHLTAKMARETFQTIPGVRVFFIDALRDRVRDGVPTGVNEVKLRRGKIIAVYTQKRDVTRRLESILTREGIRVAVLTASVPTEKREAWIEKKLQEGVQITISHPKIIETGLDLLSHPTLIFYESGYSLHTLRQASRRSWRIGQRQPVRVFYLHYEDTVQTACLRLMGKKLLVSLAMEGKFSGEGLQALGDGEDMLTAMARELVTDGGIGESATAVWRQIQAEQSRMIPTVAHDPEPVANPPAEPAEPWPSAPQPAALPVAGLLTFGSPPPPSRPVRRQKRPNLNSGPNQMPLF